MPESSGECYKSNRQPFLAQMDPTRPCRPGQRRGAPQRSLLPFRWSICQVSCPLSSCVSPGVCLVLLPSSEHHLRSLFLQVPFGSISSFMVTSDCVSSCLHIPRVFPFPHGNTGVSDAPPIDVGRSCPAVPGARLSVRRNLPARAPICLKGFSEAQAGRAGAPLGKVYVCPCQGLRATQPRVCPGPFKESNSSRNPQEGQSVATNAQRRLLLSPPRSILEDLGGSRAVHYQEGNKYIQATTSLMLNRANDVIHITNIYCLMCTKHCYLFIYLLIW